MTAQRLLRLERLPASPLDAAAHFHTTQVPRIRRELAAMDRRLDLVILFEPAGHEHRAWRLAAVQELAREAVPGRVNAVVGSDEEAVRATIAFLANAPGVTGQLLVVDGNSGATGYMEE